MSRLSTTLTVLVVLSSLSTVKVRAETTFQSGPGQVALIELYTSEGCSSCPPAEKWLGELRSDANLWKHFVPVAFHVNYWDKLGWRDALATKEFTQREYTYADAWRASSVYTPCFVRNGAEWHPQDRGPGETGSRDAGQLTVTRQDDGSFHVVYLAPAHRSETLDVSMALLGGGIVSAVQAGENSGRELRHEFVAYRLTTVPLTRGVDGNFVATLPASAAIEDQRPATTRRSLAAWVTKRGQLEPIQATGGWLE